ncbi:uncharacterized protein [Onthophagus taurus]|uniref:uncharacterized protein isoform X1 n=1 Tax=Onthophagus taurus TaxID=166361 RepID=UPI0039BE7252
MADMYCRLCLSRENVLDVFSKELINLAQLRTYIWLCSGVNILATDKITKYICNSCCQISIKIFQFRKNAMANDIALKNLLHQSHNKASEDPKHSTILTVNDFLVKKPNIKIQLGCSDAVTSVRTPEEHKQYVIHPSIFKLMKLHPKTILPSNLISTNCDPKVHISNLKIAKSDLKNVSLQDDIINTVDESSSENLVGNNKLVEKEIPQITKQIVNNTNIQEKIRSSGIWYPELVKAMLSSGSIKRNLTEEPHCTKKIKLITDIATPSTSNIANNESNVSDVSRSSEHIPHESNSKCDTTIPNVIACHDNIATNPTLQVPQEQQLDNSLTENSLVSDENLINSSHNNDKSPSVTEDETNDSDEDYVPDYFEYSLLETVEEQATYACNTCNKMFDKKRNLKCHRQRMHKTCIVCKKIFRSQISLTSHMRARCHRTIIRNQPILCLKRCDDMVENVLNVTSDSAFDVFYISDEDEQRITNQDPQLMTAAEHKHIRALYQKYHNAVPSFYKTTGCQEDIDLYTVRMGKGQATLSNMYLVLKHYRISVNLTSGDSMKVEINSASEESVPTPGISDWTGYPINRTSCEIVSTKTVDGRQIVPKPSLLTNQNVKTNQMLKETLDIQARSTITPNTSPIILNTLNTYQQLQRPTTLSDNHFQIQITNSNITPVLHTANNQIRPRSSQITDISSNQHPQLVTPIVTHTNIPQTHTLTANLNPSIMPVQQIPLIFPQTLIRTRDGYILSTNPSFTTSNVQTVPSNRNPTVLSTISHTIPNQTITFTSANQAIFRPSKRNDLPNQNVTVMPNSVSAQPPRFTVMRSSVPNTPAKSPVQKKSSSKNITDQNLASPVNNHANIKPASLSNASSKHVEPIPTIPEGKSSYLRVKAPWELK